MLSQCSKARVEVSLLEGTHTVRMPANATDGESELARIFKGSTRFGSLQNIPTASRMKTKFALNAVYAEYSSLFEQDHRLLLGSSNFITIHG